MPSKFRKQHFQEPRKCIFCGKGGISKEHLFALWLRDIFPRDAQTKHNAMYTSWLDESAPHTPAHIKRTEQGHVGSKQLKVVCRECNNGWMSELEKRTKPVLIPLIAGHKCNLPPDTQAQLSAWAAKTAMVADNLYTVENGITQSERSALMEQITPPKGWFVWMAGYEGQRWRDLSIGQVRVAVNPTPVKKPSAAQYYGQATTFGLGHVLFCVVSSSSPDVVPHFHGRDTDGLIQIWPAHPRSILWPPVVILDDEQANTVSNILKWSGAFDQSLDPGAEWTFTL